MELFQNSTITYGLYGKDIAIARTTEVWIVLDLDNEIDSGLEQDFFEDWRLRLPVHATRWVSQRHPISCETFWQTPWSVQKIWPKDLALWLILTLIRIAI